MRADSNSCGDVAEDGAKTVQWAVFSSAARDIHLRPPRTPVSEPGTGVSVLSAMQKGCKGGFEQQRSRPPPAAEAGRRGWGSAPLFQSPAKGLRKKRQAQLVRPAEQSGGEKSPCGAFLDARLAQSTRAHQKTSAYASTLRFLFSPAFPSPAKNTCISGTPCYDTNQKKSYKVIRRY